MVVKMRKGKDVSQLQCVRNARDDKLRPFYSSAWRGVLASNEKAQAYWVMPSAAAELLGPGVQSSNWDPTHVGKNGVFFRFPRNLENHLFKQRNRA